MPYKINQSKRPDIPIIPKTILKQRLILQKALILKEYSKVKQSAVLLTSLLKVGKIYDPTVRKEGLKLLIKIFKGYTKVNLFKEYKETKNLTAMLELFNENRSKNVVLCADSNNDKEFEFKKEILLSIFDELRPQDKVAFVSVARRVNIIPYSTLYSLLLCLVPLWIF